MNDSSENRQRSIVMNLSESEPRFVASYEAAVAMEGSFEDVLAGLGTLPIPGNDRTRESLRRLSLYLGTLFSELFAASVQLSFLNMPRAQVVLNRQLMEYWARNEWFLSNQDEARDELDLLIKIVAKEVQKNASAFDKEFRDAIRKNYEEWALVNPALDAKRHALPSSTDMVRLSLANAGEQFWYYGLPSIIAHGKTHGIHEVLALKPDNSVERQINSPASDRVQELRRATGFALTYGSMLEASFDLSIESIYEAGNAFTSALISDGITPETVAVKIYPQKSSDA